MNITLELTPSRVDEIESILKGYGLDSLDIVEFIIKIEKIFNVKIPDIQRKSPEEIKDYIINQEWFKELGINLDDIHDFQSLLVVFMINSFNKTGNLDWEKINDDFKKWYDE